MKLKSKRILQTLPWSVKTAFTLLETLVMTVALVVVTLLLAGIVKMQLSEKIDGSAAMVPPGKLGEP